MGCGCTGESNTEEYNKLMINPYWIKPEPGIWVFVVNPDTVIESYITYSNVTFPLVYSIPGISEWEGRSINWRMCDWQRTFSNPLYTGVPTHIELIDFFLGPSRIPIA